ncbi:hypothetical protein NO2_1733, partial [Candidatus Termititenax persephonae]
GGDRNDKLTTAPATAGGQPGTKPISDFQAKLTFDSTPTAGSTNPVTSGGIHTALSGKQGTIGAGVSGNIVAYSGTAGTLNTLTKVTAINATAASRTDSNIPTEKAVGAALDGKQAKLTFDSTPTAGSTNPVTSGGIHTALSGKQAAITWATSITASSTNSQYPTAKAVWDLVAELLPGTLQVSASLTSTQITWYAAVRECIKQTHAAGDVPTTVKADMNARGYTANASDSSCIAYQDTYAQGKKKVYRLLTEAEWIECYNMRRLNSHSQYEWVGDVYDYSNRVLCRYDNLSNRSYGNPISSTKVAFSSDIIRKFAAQNPRAALYVCGCYVNIADFTKI